MVFAPIKSLLEKLIMAGFARRNHKAVLLPKGRKGLTNKPHSEILRYYNSKIRGILNYYSFAGNYGSMGKVI